MSRRRKPIPEFQNEAEERAFWESHDSADYVDWTKGERAVLSNLKPSAQSIPSAPAGELLETRAKRGSRQKFDKVLGKLPNVKPDEGDRR